MNRDYMAGFEDGIDDCTRMEARCPNFTPAQKAEWLDRGIDQLIDELVDNRDDQYYWIGYIAAYAVVRNNIK